MPDIEGATDLSYTPTAADVGQRLRYRERVTGPGGTSRWVYSPWSKVVQADTLDRRQGGSSIAVGVTATGAGQKLEEGDPTQNETGGSKTTVGANAYGAGTKSEVYPQVTVHAADDWTNSGGVTTIQTTAPADSAGKTGLLVISGASSSFTLNSGVPNWTLVDSSTGTDSPVYTFARPMDGSADDSPLITSDTSGTMRNAVMVVLNSTSVDDIVPMAPWAYRLNSSDPVDPPNVETDVDSALALAVLVVTYELRTVTPPGNMSLTVKTDGAVRRQIVVAHEELDEAQIFNPDPFTFTGGSSPTVVAAYALLPTQSEAIPAPTAVSLPTIPLAVEEGVEINATGAQFNDADTVTHQWQLEDPA